MPDVQRVRRNIDSLQPDELAAYEHAVTRLREISDADPESVDGYTYFEQLHDGDKGPCEHANDTFMPWHRAHLFLFEEALRRSDPPRTADVTLPYWDWSALPSGTRYPKAFENPGSPLFDAFRNDTPICRSAGAGSCQTLPFPRSLLETTALSKQQWSTAVAKDSRMSFGGFAGGQSDCSSPFGGGFGALEVPAHNDMHDKYVGGNMKDPSSAALDAIFFSFHCYIDLLWWQWQQRFTTDTDLDAELCGLFKEPGRRFRVRDTLDTSQLGYVFEYTAGEPAPVPARRPDAPFPTHPAIDFVASATRPPELVRTLDVTVPAAGFAAAQLEFSDVNATAPFSYGADIYLTPPGEEIRTQDRAFRERYLADMLFFWKAHHHGHHGDHGEHRLDLVVDLGAVLQALARTHAGEQWRVSVALTPSDGHSHHEAAEAAEPAAQIDFGTLTLDIR